MNKIFKKISIFLILCVFAFLIVCVPKTNVKAAETDYTKKIVSVVFDNSGSMEGDKYAYATYSLQLLMGLLSERDELIITPLNTNNSAVTNINQSIIVDLTNPNRGQVIKDVLNRLPGPQSTTPPDALDVGLQHLVNRGLQTNDQAGDQNGDVEYWFVILSDGTFNKCYTIHDVSNTIEGKIKNYSFLNTIYYSFGANSPDLKDTNVVKNYPVTSYNAATPEEITSQMMEVANKLTRRFSVTIDPASLGTKVVKLNVADYNMTISSICVTAQNSGATLKSIKLDGKDISNVTEKIILDSAISVVGSYSAEVIKKGCLLTISPSTPLDSGIIELEFDAPINQLDVMVEPAIYITPYFQVQGNNGLMEVDMQYINSTLKPGEKIKVQYRMYDQLSNQEISSQKIKDVFGDTVTKVTYCGNQYAVGDDITLVKGKNMLTIDVQFKKNNFSIVTSMMCVIEEDPTFYRIESTKQTNVDNDITKNKIEYNIFVDNKKLSSKAEVEKFTITIKLEDPKGNETDGTYTIQSDGTIIFEFKTDLNSFGNYNVTCKVVSPEKISRTDKQTVLVMPKDFEVELLTVDQIIYSEYQLEDNTLPIEFIVKSDGIEIPLDGSVFTYKVEVDNYDVTTKAEVNGGKIIFIPSTSTLPNLSIGTKKITVTVTNGTIGSKSAVCEFEIQKTIYKVEKIDTQNENIDIYNLKNCKAIAQFRVTRNGTPLSYEDVKKLYDNGEIDFNYKKWGIMFLLPYGIETSVENVAGQGVIVCKVVSDIFAPLDNLLAAFISTKQKSIEVSYDDSSAVEDFPFNSVSIISRIIRIIIIILILALIYHIACFLIGFITLHPFPSGVIVTVRYGSKTTMTTRPVNMDNKAIAKWHVKRFFTLRPFRPQDPFGDGVHGFFEMNKGKDEVFRPLKTMKLKEFRAQITKRTDTGAEVFNWVQKLKNATSTQQVVAIKGLSKLSTEDVLALFRDSNKELINPQKTEIVDVPLVNGKVYASVKVKKDGETTIKTMVFFIKNN